MVLFGRRAKEHGEHETPLDEFLRRLRKGSEAEKEQQQLLSQARESFDILLQVDPENTGATELQRREAERELLAQQFEATIDEFKQYIGLTPIELKVQVYGGSRRMVGLEANCNGEQLNGTRVANLLGMLDKVYNKDKVDNADEEGPQLNDQWGRQLWQHIELQPERISEKYINIIPVHSPEGKAYAATRPEHSRIQYTELGPQPFAAILEHLGKLRDATGITTYFNFTTVTPDVVIERPQK